MTATPARPHTRLTDDGRRMREVLSYARRGSRLTPRQQEAWDAHADRWVVPEEVVESPMLDWAEVFERQAPLIIEIGSGVGEATAALAARRAEANVLAVEVWRPGVASTLERLADAGLGNVRLVQVDAAWLVEHRCAPASVAGLWTFFPDPWHKTRHHKRRLVTPRFAAIVADRLEPGAEWRLATDWPAYADQMRDVLDAEPAVTGGPVERWVDRPVTRFERKGLAAGRPSTDLRYVRH